MKRNFLILTACFVLASCGFSGPGDSKAEISSGAASFSIATWNVQTFFDGITEGTEYSSFKSGKNWNSEKYTVRLKRLCEVLSTLNADIFVLEEIENEAVIYDISNQFAGNSWKASENWNYACFAKEKGGSIGCAVLSKLPLVSLKTHALNINTEESSQPSMRPLMEVEADIDGTTVTIFVNHWKSKSGGAEKSEIWRNWQESVLSKRICAGGRKPCIICGDFNRDILEFECDFTDESGSANIILKNKCSPIDAEVSAKVYSPWFNSDGTYSTQIGSYYYNGEWERIDHIFSYGNTKITAFEVRTEEPWALEDKTPNAYKIYTGSGYSDHLPLIVEVSVQ